MLTLKSEHCCRLQGKSLQGIWTFLSKRSSSIHLCILLRAWLLQTCYRLLGKVCILNLQFFTSLGFITCCRNLSHADTILTSSSVLEMLSGGNPGCRPCRFRKLNWRCIQWVSGWRIPLRAHVFKTYWLSPIVMSQSIYRFWLRSELP